MFIGEYQDMMAAAVDMQAKTDADIPRDDMIIGFQAISIIVFCLQFLVGWLLLVWASKNRVFAFLVFLLYFVGNIYYSISSALVVLETYPDFFVTFRQRALHWSSMIFSVLTFSVLIYGIGKGLFLERRISNE